MGKHGKNDKNDNSFSFSSFAASLKRKVSPPVVQPPGTATINAGELQEAGIDIKKGDSRLKSGITADDLTFNERKKLEARRQLELEKNK